MHAFYGASVPDETIVEEVNTNKAQSDYLQTLRAEGTQATTQSLQQAEDAFFGIEDTQPKAQQFGEPIPGYSGVNRRVTADNVFGMTYAEARRMAMESQNRIVVEKKETLRETSKWVPQHQRDNGGGW